MLSHCVNQRSNLVAKIRNIAGRSLIVWCLWTTLVQWCVAARFCAAELVITAVQDQKANATLTELSLKSNKVGEARATALADALQATVSACGHTAFQECASCCQRYCFAQWCEQLASPSCCAVSVAVFTCVSKENVAWRGVLFASCSQVDVALFQNRTGLIGCLVIGICLIAVRHQSVSSGPWRRLANDDRDAVCQGMAWRGGTWHYASKKQAGRWTQYSMLLPERMSCCF